MTNKMEKWKKWVPTKNIPGTLYYEEIVSNKKGLTLLFSDESNTKTIKITFNGLVYSYRFTEEGCLLKTLDYLVDTHKKKDFHGWCMFEVQNSNYLTWFKEESYDAYDTETFAHYAIYTEDGLIEVLSPYPPEIEVKDLVKSSK